MATVRDVSARGTDNKWFQRVGVGNKGEPAPRDWGRLGVKFNALPAAVSWGADRLDIFGLGTDNQMFHKVWDGNQWLPSPTDWEPLGGGFNIPPASPP